MQFSKLLIATVAFALSASALPTPDEGTTTVDKSTEATGNICPSRSDVKQFCCNKSQTSIANAEGLLALAASLPTNTDVNGLAAQLKDLDCLSSNACSTGQQTYCCNQKMQDGLIVYQNCGPFLTGTSV